ncbi:MAG: YccF domain-containing protein [Hydrogeniiclostridium sp.]
MSCLGNILWFFFGGLIQGLSWCLVGLLWCITIVGIPVGVQCFKLAGLSFFPFGKQVIYGGGAGSLLLNLIWLLFGGIPLAIISALDGLLFCITIVGIPFGMQCFKLAKLALMPFGTEVVPSI